MNNAAKIKHPVTFHADGSGAPCVIVCDGQVYAFNYLGEVKCNRIDNKSGTVGRYALYNAKTLYMKILQDAPVGWMQKNSEMYNGND